MPVDFAAMLVCTMARHGIRASSWSRPGVGVRVYIGRQFLSVSRGGDVSERYRGSVSFARSSLYPGERVKFDAAMKAYRSCQERALARMFEDGR